VNRAALRASLFHDGRDYGAFEALIVEARSRIDVPLLAYALMPTHFHLVVWPREDWHLSAFMRWLTQTYTQRLRRRTETVGTGALFQGRYKSFPVQQDDHFYRVCRYVERNPLRAGLCVRAEDWRWSSLRQRGRNDASVPLDPWPIPRPVDWTARVNVPQSAAELANLRHAVQKGVPFGEEEWAAATATRLGLERRLRRRGRPPQRSDDAAPLF
jgi:putative transposase